tara:strand:- start:293 stop:715 length:423 start_codon:yes stop_codon:yes gene_type:complete
MGNKFMNPNSDEIKNILNAAKTIAVVGLSDNPSRASFNVAKYLKQQRYVIFPVNPTLEDALDQKCYSDLDEIGEEIDIVDIFRRSEFVPEIVEKSIKIGAKCIWMQDDVTHEAAAQMARNAGLDVIMNDCILRQHKALFD